MSVFTIVQKAKSVGIASATFTNPTTAGNAIVAYWAAFGHGPAFSPPAPGAPTACTDDATPSTDTFELFSPNFPTSEFTENIWLALNIQGGATSVGFSGATFIETGGPSIIVAEVSCSEPFFAWGVSGSGDVTVVGGGIDQRPNGTPADIQFAAGFSATTIRTGVVAPSLDSGDARAINSNNAVALVASSELFVIYSDYNESTPPGWTSSNGTIIDSTNQTDGLTGVLAWASFPFLSGAGCAGGSPAVAIFCDSPPDGSVGVPYDHTFLTASGTPPFTFSITAGSLPDGLSLDSSTGEVSGTPTTPGTFSFTATVTDSLSLTASVGCSITINGVALTIDCGSPPDGFIGVAYDHTFPASGGTPPYTFAITSGSLPTGITLNTSTGEISGVPTVAGTFAFTIQVTDSLGTHAHADCSITILSPVIITCSITIIPGPSVGCNNPPDGTVGGAYDHFLAGSGGTPPLTVAIIVGSLPPGLAIDAATAEITGTPTLAGTFPFTVQITDSLGQTGQVNCSITITSGPPPGILTGSCDSPPPGVVGTAYSHQLTASGGTPPYTFALGGIGSLPPGLTMNSSGLISGTPTTAGWFTFSVIITDATRATVVLYCGILISGNCT